MNTPATVPGHATFYHNTRFRSMLEARWAVFFDVLGIGWIYEPGIYTLPGGVRYMPDFHIPCLNTMLEVKPRDYLDGINDDTRKFTAYRKAYQLALVRDTMFVMLFAGEPRRNNGKCFRFVSTEKGAAATGSTWYVCGACGYASTTAAMNVNCSHGLEDRSFGHPRLLAAQLLAKETRFDHDSIRINLEGS
jgi:hypothetical protein